MSYNPLNKLDLPIYVPNQQGAVGDWGNIPSGNVYVRVLREEVDATFNKPGSGYKRVLFKWPGMPYEYFFVPTKTGDKLEIMGNQGKGLGRYINSDSLKPLNINFSVKNIYNRNNETPVGIFRQGKQVLFPKAPYKPTPPKTFWYKGVKWTPEMQQKHQAKVIADAKATALARPAARRARGLSSYPSRTRTTSVKTRRRTANRRSVGVSKIKNFGSMSRREKVRALSGQ